MAILRYLNDSPSFRSKTLSIRGIGIHEVMPPCLIERPNGTDDYLFMLFFDTVEIGTDRRPIAPGTLLMWDRSSPHFYGSCRGRWMHSWLHCDGSAVGKLRRMLAITGDRVVTLSDPSTVDRHLLEMHAEIARRSQCDAVIVGNLFENMIRTIVRREAPGDPARPIPAPIAAARQRIDSHYAQPLSLDALAKLAGLSRRHFCTQFRRYVGTPPMAYLMHRRLQVAAALIRGTPEAIGRIGQRVGILDPYYFSKQFKACFGVSPKRLRMDIGADR